MSVFDARDAGKGLLQGRRERLDLEGQESENDGRMNRAKQQTYNN